jgi:glycine betaine/proline transport system ATP-binding protein
VPVVVGTVLESAARMMTLVNQNIAHVVDANGKPVGSIDLGTIISAMVTPISHEKVPQAAE